jgi:hypothetical protein
MVRQKQMHMATQWVETILQNELPARVYTSVMDKPKLLIREKKEQAIKILIKGAYMKN